MSDTPPQPNPTNNAVEVVKTGATYTLGCGLMILYLAVGCVASAIPVIIGFAIIKWLFF